MENKVALVTGGGRGIGAALCRRLAVHGYFVYLNCRKKSEAAVELLAELRAAGGHGRLIEFDVCAEAALHKAIDKIEHTRIDLLVNNAGCLVDKLIYQTGVDDWDRILDTNFFGALSVYRASAAKLAESADPVVINLGSIAGIKPRPGQGAYAVSKAMLIAWTREKGQAGEGKTRFYCISPGPVNTAMLGATRWGKDPAAKKRIPAGRFSEPGELAEIILLLAERPVLENGSNVVYDGGFTRTLNT